MTKTLIYFLILFYVSSVLLNLEIINNNPGALINMLSYTILHHFTYVQNILLIIFIESIGYRVKSLTELDKIAVTDEKLFVEQIGTALEKIHDIIQLVNDFFKPSFAQSMTFLYLSVVSNIYWIFRYFLGFHSAGCFEFIINLFPSLSIILYLADCDKMIKKNILKIISTVTKLQSPRAEEILIFTMNKTFHFGVFNRSIVGYSTLAKVSKFLRKIREKK